MTETIYTSSDKRIVRGPNVTQLMPAKYPWAWEWFLDSNKNHWVPGEVGMGRSIYQFEHVLTPSEKHIFITVFAYLTTSDILAMRNVSLAVMEKITAPEIQTALMRHGFDETIHSWTYQHCLECLNLDANDIYTRNQRWPEMNAKFQLSNKYLKRMLELHTLETKEDVEEFIYGYIFFALIFEGVWFYNGFTPIFNMNRRQLMLEAGEQLQYILRDEVNHVKLGIRIIRGIIEEEGIVLDVNRIKQMFIEADACEENYIKMVLKDGMIGHTVELHMQQSKAVSNRRLKQLGLEPVFPDVAPPFKWLDEIAGGIRKEGNFFETKVKEYQSGAALDFGDTVKKTDEQLPAAWKPEW